jgi:hypothetical protein
MCTVTGPKIELAIGLVKWLKVCSLKYLGLIGSSILIFDEEARTKMPVLVGFNPVKQMGLEILFSCNFRDILFSEMIGMAIPFP